MNGNPWNWGYTYDPYGRTVIETYDASLNGGSGAWAVSGAGGAGRSKYGNPFLWTGQRYDAGVLLYHFLFRTYSPSLGRWLARDPAGYADGVNLLEYVSSGPLSWTDPLGLCNEFWRDTEEIIRDYRAHRERASIYSCWGEHHYRGYRFRLAGSCSDRRCARTC